MNNSINQTNQNQQQQQQQQSSSNELGRMNSKKRKRVVNLLVRSVGQPIHNGYVSSGIGKASFVHALIVIFLEFFAWGLLTDQAITVLNETFPNSTFLANGLIQGLKGILSFLSAPLIGAMSDIWGRKVFLLITVFFTCLPIPLMRINPMWYFAMISISGMFAVTFSVVFAYVADVTDESNRTTTYGLVSATFAASLITSPALGSYLSRFYSENFVIALATAIAVFDLFFILVAVPESLPEKLREKNKSITWENIDPFKSLKIVFADRTITLLCITVFLSYLPEAGQYSCFFVYLKLIIGFSQDQVAYFIAYVGIFSCIAQAVILVVLIKYFGSKQSVIIGLAFQVVQLALYGFAAQPWLIWFSGMLAAMSSIGYPAISAYISNQSHADQQGVSQGMVTGIRGLCNGIGPALYGFVFWIFRVSLNENSAPSSNKDPSSSQEQQQPITYASTHLLPGPPFLFGSVLALSAIFVTCLIPRTYKASILVSSSQRTSKDKTVVKIGNSSSTYNRTSSSSSLAAILGGSGDGNGGCDDDGSNENLLSHGHDEATQKSANSASNYAMDHQEKQLLLMQSPSLLSSSSSSAAAAAAAASAASAVLMPANSSAAANNSLDIESGGGGGGGISGGHKNLGYYSSTNTLNYNNINSEIINDYAIDYTPQQTKNLKQQHQQNLLRMNSNSSMTASAASTAVESSAMLLGHHHKSLKFGGSASKKS